MDHFTRLGLPRRFVLDGAQLEKQYLASSRAIHPDFHTITSSADLNASMELSAGLNEAYNTLKDPFTRADYLLTLEGGPSASEHKQVPGEFLAEMLELREQVEEARATGTSDSPVVSLLSRGFQDRLNELMVKFAETFSRYESIPADDSKKPNLRLQLRSLLNAAKYIRGLIRDLHAD